MKHQRKVIKSDTPTLMDGRPHTKFCPIFQIRFLPSHHTFCLHFPQPYYNPNLGNNTNDFKNAIFPYNKTPSAGQARMGIFAARRTKNKNFLHTKTHTCTSTKFFGGPIFKSEFLGISTPHSQIFTNTNKKTTPSITNRVASPN